MTEKHPHYEVICAYYRGEDVQRYCGNNSWDTYAGWEPGLRVPAFHPDEYWRVAPKEPTIPWEAMNKELCYVFYCHDQDEWVCCGQEPVKEISEDNHRTVALTYQLHVFAGFDPNDADRNTLYTRPEGV